jgi:hypothetical protein
MAALMYTVLEVSVDPPGPLALTMNVYSPGDAETVPAIYPLVLFALYIVNPETVWIS